MYRDNELLRHTNGLCCPECYKADNSHRLHIFKSKWGLDVHISKAHSLSKDQKARVRAVIADYKKGSLLELCFERGYLY